MRLLFEEVSLRPPVFADELQLSHCGTSKEESPAVEEKEDQTVAEHKDAASVDQSQANNWKQANLRRKKRNL